MGRRSYRTLVQRVIAHPQRRWHVMVHAAGWFQGASRVGAPEQLGVVGTADKWNNVFRGGGQGTVDDPGVGWVLSAFWTCNRCNPTLLQPDRG
jgi:hypothetical protein